jgi:hypothetical protein
MVNVTNDGGLVIRTLDSDREGVISDNKNNDEATMTIMGHGGSLWSGEDNGEC